MAAKSNILFCFESAADTATLTASSEASADLVVENLQNDSRTDEVWRSVAEETPGVTEYIDIVMDDTNGLRTVAVLAIVDLMIGATGTVKIEGWADGIAVGTAVVSVEKIVFGALAGFGVGGNGEGAGAGAGYGGGGVRSVAELSYPLALIYLGGWYTLKYWRITITDEFATYVQAARLFLGGYWQPENNYARGAVRQVLDRTSLVESVGGQEYGDDRRHRLVFKGVSKGMREPDADYLWSKFLQYRTSKPFIVSIRPTERLEQAFTSIWGRFDSSSLTHQGFDDYEAELSIKEWL